MEPIDVPYKDGRYQITLDRGLGTYRLLLKWHCVKHHQDKKTEIYRLGGSDRCRAFKLPLLWSRNRKSDEGMAFSDRVINRSRRILRAVNMGHLVEPEIRQFPEQIPVLDNDVSKLAYSHHGRQLAKWDHYFRIYDRHFKRFRNASPKFLEIGVNHGGSLQLWRKYFGPKAVIFGIDIDPRCSVIDDAPAVNVRIGSQTDRNFLNAVVQEMSGIDIVLDDGSHNSNHQRTTFDLLFPLVNPNGIYVVEDLHTNYWRGEYEGGWKRRSTFIEQAKDIIDDLHGWWHRKAQRLPGAHKTIESLNFYDSMIVIEKRPTNGPFAKAMGKPSF